MASKSCIQLEPLGGKKNTRNTQAWKWWFVSNWIKNDM